MNIIETDVTDSATKLSQHVAEQKLRSGEAMAAYFYRSHVAYQHELDTLIFRSWMFAGHTSQIPNAGDYFLFDVGEESIIVSRDAKQQIHAVFNNCRHRGSRVCEEHQGNRKTFVCPYHGWVYELDGRLKSARHMESLEGFDPKDHGLEKPLLEISHGLIFINCNRDADSLSEEIKKIEIPLAAHELSNAKVAACRNYPVQANWKLVLENYLECYHCATAHRSYANIHTLKDLEHNVKALNDELLARCEEITGVKGIGNILYEVYLHGTTQGGGVESFRHALYPGQLTGSRDGQAVAPLLGKLKDYDGGVADFQFGPLTFLVIYPDHGVMYRFTPRSLTETDMTLWWFVRADAEEGKDYNLDDLTWLWDKTTKEDEYIIRRNSEGVNSRFYKPGPYHPEFEYACMDFVAWYLERMSVIN
ncbi:MAG: SRPBCC family protein [Pseudomonadales bacterium]